MDPAVSTALRVAAGWLEDAGYRVEQAAPPHFEEIARLFFTLIRSEERSSTTGAIERLGDDELRRARASTMAYASELNYEDYIKAFGRRAAILREWQLFFERYPLLLMPVSSLRPVPFDYDQQGDEAVARMLTSHHPMLAISMLGLPAIAIPTGQADGVPVGVQLVAGRFREDICLAAAEVIEARYPSVRADDGLRFRETGFRGPETTRPKSPRGPNWSLQRRNRGRQSPPIGGLSAAAGKSPLSSDCVVGLEGFEPPTRDYGASLPASRETEFSGSPKWPRRRLSTGLPAHEERACEIDKAR